MSLGHSLSSCYVTTTYTVPCADTGTLYIEYQNVEKPSSLVPRQVLHFFNGSGNEARRD